VANNNLSTNLYTLITGGAETEALVSYKNISGFANFSYNKRINEYIQDRTISINKTQTTWVPSHTANAGITWTDQKFMTSLSVERQGAVYRRNSDLGPVDPLFGNNTNIPPYDYNYPVYRPKTVPAWISVNFRFMYKWNDKLEMGLNIFNLFNSYQTLAKNNNYPFDYLREGRRFMFDVTATF
jgi:iron complex outermembrane receptor protein